jgi:O-antigen/teichoic acid export membrane protein
MTLLRKATGGVAWTVAAGLASRGIGMLGTLMITRFLAPEVMGEVTTATVLAFTASWLTQLGLPQYVMLRSEGARDKVFHATVISVVVVTVALAVMAACAPMLGRWFDTPHLASLLPGMALAVLIRRIGSIPDKLLLKQMRFRTVAMANACGELVFATCAVTLVATTSLAGMGIVIANIVQACVTTGVVIGACGTREWLTPVRLRWERVREILAFGIPMGIESIFHESARYADKLVFTKLFGPARTGEYNLAYSLADIPASQVGEQVSNVVLPTFLHLEGQRRQDVLVRAIGLLSLVTFPMAVGLGIVAPTLIEVLLPPKWQGVAPFLMVLAVVSVFRPVNELISQFLISREQVRLLMRLEIFRVLLLFGSLLALGQFGPIPAAFSIGLSAFGHTILLVREVHGDGHFIRDLLRALRAPLVGCAGMCVAVLVARMQLEPHLPHDVMLLSAEIVFGAACYVICLYLLERTALREVMALARGLLRRSPA